MKQKCFFVSFAMSCLLLADLMGQQPGTVAAANRKLAETWIDLLNSHDTNAVAKLYADNCRLFSPNWEGVKTGSAAAKETYSRYFSSTPDLQEKITRMIVTDSSVVLEYISEGTLLHPENGTPAYMRGKKYVLQNCTRMDIRDGRITEQATYFDQVSFLRQMGFFDQP